MSEYGRKEKEIAAIRSWTRQVAMVKEGEVRPLAICVFRKMDLILVAECFDAVKGETFYRPLGGTIEFGEYGQETIAREIREELGLEVRNPRYLGTLQNIFTYEGKKGHEIVLIYEGDLSDRSIYDRTSIEGLEENTPFTAVWKSLGYFQSGRAPLYPEGLLDLIVEKNLSDSSADDVRGE